MKAWSAGFSKIEWVAHGLVWAGIALLLSRVLEQLIVHLASPLKNLK